MEFTEQERIGHDKKAEANKADIKAAALERIQSLIDKHIVTLALKWDQTVSQDDYGNFLFEKWEKEQSNFIEDVLLKDEIIQKYLVDETIIAFRSLGLEDIATNHENEIHERFVQIQKIMHDTIKDFKIL